MDLSVSSSFKTALIIDDMETDQFICKMVIEATHFADNIVVHSNAGEALNFLKTNPEDSSQIIFLDIQMPGLNGFEFLEEFGNMKKESKNLPVIVMLTSSQDPSDLKKA